jgi:NADH dehydrogenase
MDSPLKKRIVILGAGFGGLYTAMNLEKKLKYRKDIEVILINRENYFVYQPMLSEVIGGSVGILDTVSSLRRLLKKTQIYIREIEQIDLEKKTIYLAPQFSHAHLPVSYDTLVFSLGNVTDFKNMPGLHEHALGFKNLADAIDIRNRIIEVVEDAANTENPILKKQLLTFVVGGGGFSGTEAIADMNDFVRKLVKDYPTISQEDIRMVLVHSKERLMDRELSPSLALYAEKILKKRGVEIIFKTQLIAASQQEAVLSDGIRIPAKTIVSTVPSSANPLIEYLNLPMEKNRIKTFKTMQIEGQTDLFAVGDCAYIPQDNGTACPPTAQFAIREGKTLSENLIAHLDNKPLKEFNFTSIGMMGALGHHRAFAELFGKIKFSGFFAWLLWRAIYWIKLPGFDRKLKVAFSWVLDTLIPPESVQLKLEPSQGIIPLHFEKDEIIFHEGDVGDYLYIITKGQVEVLKSQEGHSVRVATIDKGQYFGEMALVNQKTRSATIRCLEPTDVLALKKKDFGLLVSSFSQLKSEFEKVSSEREKL